MPRWAKIMIYGAVIAVAVDYFVGPATKDVLGMR